MESLSTFFVNLTLTLFKPHMYCSNLSKIMIFLLVIINFLNYCYYESELGKNNAAKQQLVESENDD